ncbi:hypothetical protein FA15DRAFT_595830 [Coprinopsis marcescibilis]|uniref:Uncharacterized protein n=1 Tax=Coprinopsis marcescibilis TaxID=230819 RepID=A0A5C3L368_COPMA|nr:hypothetical protein FA15DRAFT_595830 [Coprinopsis marcescibilis]
MGFGHISRDVKLAALHLHSRGLLGLWDIITSCGFSQHTFFHVKCLWNETGDVLPCSIGSRGWPCMLIREDIEYLLELVRDNPTYFLDEMEHLLTNNCFISVHFTMIHQQLEQLGMSRK